MITPNVGGPDARVPTTRDCLVQLNRLVPKNEASISTLSPQEKEALQGKIADLLKQVLSTETSFIPEQHTNLMNIRELAAKAKQMHLLSNDGKAALKQIAEKTKEVGLSHLTAPRDFTIVTRDGAVAVNSDVLKANSSFFKAMIKGGMKEAKTRSVELDVSKRTIEFLMKCLHESPKKAIDLPDDNDLVFELVSISLSHGFDNLNKKLEPAVTKFIKENRDAVLENGYAWVDLLKGRSDNLTAAKWLTDLIPLILENYDIPLKPSDDLPGLFEIPIEHLNSLFDVETGGLFKQLPIVLEIKDEEDLDRFLTTMQETKLESSLPVKLLCRMELEPKEEMSLQQLAKASNIELNIEKIVIPPGTVMYGKEILEKYFGKVDVLPLPAGIGKLLDSNITINGPNGELIDTGVKWKEKFMLAYLPNKIDGQPLTLNLARHLAAHPKGGGHAATYATTYTTILAKYGNKAVESSGWFLFSTDVIEGTRNKTYEEQEALVAAIPGCEIPDLLSAHIGILIHFIHTGERLYGRNPWTYTRCKDTVTYGGVRYPTIVGGFGADGLIVDPSHIVDTFIGAGALRKFF